MKTDPTFWILARASGFTAYILLTLSVLAGLAVKSKPFGKAVKVASATDAHRFLALLGLGALAVHGFMLTLDQTIHLSFASLVIPGLAPYRPLWTGIGVLTAELMIVVYASFSLKKRIGHKNWRRLHWATYAIFLGATAHGLMAGTDSVRAFGVYVAAVFAVAAATAWRAFSPLAKQAAQPAARAVPQPVSPNS
jgi:sulfoxide reductase heme-binding subunit YedZ